MIKTVEEALDQRWQWLAEQAEMSEASRAQTLRDLEDDGHREDDIRQSYTGRYPLELLQNAHDACTDGHRVGTVEFVVTDTALLVANEGMPFDGDRVESLTRHGSSEKLRDRARRRTIGYKGVGFIAVFELCDRPQVIAEALAFGFDRGRAAREVTKKLGSRPGATPARYFPFRLSDPDWSEDADVVAELFERRYVTIVRLPYRTQVTQDSVRAALERTLHPELLLFLPGIKRIRIVGGGATLDWRSRRSSRRKVGRIVSIAGGATDTQWLVATDDVRVTKAEVEALRDPLWEDVRRLNVGVALPWKRGHVDPDGPTQPVHVYFPTDDQLGRGVLVHGDFYVDKSRRRIETEGTPGLVSQRVAEAAAKTLARVAASEAHQGQRLLAALAPKDDADGFGRVLGTAIDSELADAPIARSASGARPRRPRQLTRLASPLPPELEAELARWVTPLTDILMPGDDAGPAGELLESLGAPAFEPEELAARLDGRGAGDPAEDVLGVVGRWLVALPPWDESQTVRVLRDRPIVQDTEGRWRQPGQTVTCGPDSPPLPKALGIYEVPRPRKRYALAATVRLEIPELTGATALEILLDGLESRRFGKTSAQKRAALDLAWSLWAVSRGPFSLHRNRLGVLSVPTRKARQSGSTAWRSAKHTYFGQDWTGSPVLEAAYGPLGDPEFLSLSVPSAPPARRSRRQFFEALGVASTPRLVTLEAMRSGLARWFAWSALSEVSEAWACRQGHPESPRRYEGTVADRLDRLLERDTKSGRRALAAALLEFDEPFGPKASIRCDNQDHGGQAARKPTIGYQRWLLETNPWIPVRDDGVSAFRPPSEAWYDLPGRPPLRLPRAELPREHCARLELVRGTSPSPDAIVAALSRLADDDAGPSVSEPVTADWLLGRLERSLGTSKHVPARPPFPARRDGQDIWSASPHIPDLPGLSEIPGLEVLRSGRWRALRRVYDLPRASEVVSYNVEHGAKRRARAELPMTRRAEILAALHRLGLSAADLDRAAVRLARLREQPVEWLQLRIAVGSETTVEVTPALHLRTTRDAKNRVVGGTLYWATTEGQSPMETAQQLAEFIGAEDESAEITLVLQDAPARLAHLGVTQEDVDDASAELARHRRKSDESPDALDRPEDLLDNWWEDVLDDDQEASAEGPERQVARGPDSRDPGREDDDHHEEEDDDESASRGREPVSLPDLDVDSIEIRNRDPQDLTIFGDEGPGAPNSGGSGSGGGGGATDWARLREENARWGARGEQTVYDVERRDLAARGQDPDAVVWEAKRNDTSPYDIRSLDESGEKIFIEVKATPAADVTRPFPISAAQLRFALREGRRVAIYRVTDVKSAAPEIDRYRDPISSLRRGSARLRLRNALLEFSAPRAED